MRKEDRQDKIEHLTYSVIEELAAELGTNYTYLPEVYWLSKDLRFEDLGLPNKFLQAFSLVQKYRISFFFVEPKIILVGQDNKLEIAEEAGHFLQYTNSMVPKSMRLPDAKSFIVLTEMFGYFCSKLISPERKVSCMVEFDSIEKLIEDISSLSASTLNKNFNQYGYKIGESLYNHYISGMITSKEVRKLLFGNFEEKHAAYSTLLYFLQDVLKISSK